MDLRLTWDLPADPDLTAKMWGRIKQGRVLFVEARLTSGTVSALTALNAGIAAPAGPRISLLGESDAIASAVERIGLQGISRTELLLLPPYGSDTQIETLATMAHRLVPSLWSTPQGKP